jgi:hypothetical protein
MEQQDRRPPDRIQGGPDQGVVRRWWPARALGRVPTAAPLVLAAAVLAAVAVTGPGLLSAPEPPAERAPAEPGPPSGPAVKFPVPYALAGPDTPAHGNAFVDGTRRLRLPPAPFG